MVILIERADEEIVIDIKENNGEDNLEDIKFSFLKNGITIIVGENNVGKTNILNYIYNKSEKWDNFTEEFLWDKENKIFYKSLPLFFEKEDRIFSQDYKDARNLGKDWDESYYYRLYYFDLKTVISPLIKDKQEVEIKRLKTRYCKISVIKDGNRKVRIWRGAQEKVQEKSWEIDYGESRNFTRGHTKSGIDEYDGYNPGMRKHHGIKYAGSGQSKYETLKNLIEKLTLEKTETRKQNTKEIYSSVLLIDEPEMLLNPFRVKRMSSLIKNAVKKSNLTIILVTHSPSFLSHFIYEKSARLIVAQKDYESGKLNPPLCFWETIDKIRLAIGRGYKKYTKKMEEVENIDLYKKKWKRLLNQDTLRIFFAKKVLFVEGLVEYYLFNNVIREELGHEIEKKGIEIIPIFGKLHHAFFSELAKKLNLECWFLVDYDGKVDLERGRTEWESNDKISHEKFWKANGEGKNNEKDVGITHSKDTRISWIHSDTEDFLRIPINKKEWKNKLENLINRSEDVIKNLKKEEPKKIEALARIISFFSEEKE